ncbi:kinase-like protein [Cylindrobasidium torrendii FP15055 ss-10]|uniref:Kinase-like protein n=1 Tax=Cylindrobasidium torrendii FP15055 ss-10 TaxID=1314674 RepID=A0A0D7ATT3_9AGAR|nr:kinase-like protein [Cylindrobasidium torrendii FP15055 ss-10]
MQEFRPPLSRPITTTTSSGGSDVTMSPSTPQRIVVKRVSLTSKKNWWMVEMNEDGDDHLPPVYQTSIHEEFAPAQESRYAHRHYPPSTYHSEQRILAESPPTSPPQGQQQRHPNAIFSFPTPTAYSAPPNPSAHLSPFAQGSASELFKCVVKKPDVVQIEINGEMQTNAQDVTAQFLAELRVYTTVTHHRNMCTFLGSLENVGMVLEFLEGRTLYDVVKERPELSREQKIDYHDQLLDGLTHLHSFGLSHGDLSLLNVQVINSSNTVKLLDFGRSVSADSIFTSPDDEPSDPFAHLMRPRPGMGITTPAVPTRLTEQIHPGTRPFCAPEIMRGECQDPLLADAYSFGMILVCLDLCRSVDVKPWDQRKDLLPKGFFDGCQIFEERAKEYLRKVNAGRRRLSKTDLFEKRYMA